MLNFQKSLQALALLVVLDLSISRVAAFSWPRNLIPSSALAPSSTKAGASSQRVDIADLSPSLSQSEVHAIFTNMRTLESYAGAQSSDCFRNAADLLKNQCGTELDMDADARIRGE